MLASIVRLEDYAGDRPIFCHLVPKERKGDDTSLTLTEEVHGKAEFFMSIIDVRMDVL